MKTAIPIPAWLKTSAVYQINPRTFSKEGTINAVRAELPRLKELGFRIMYLCPIFEEDPSENRDNWSIRQNASETDNPKNPYRMNDYFKIDEEYGTMQDLEDFVAAAHALDMKVVLDLVYLHIGPNAPILRRHPEFAQHNEDGSVRCTYWRFPYLDFNSAGLREYLWCNMVYYIGVIDADGFRCDVGDGVPNDFWLEGRRRIQAIKPDAVLINEGSAFDRLSVSFDSCYTFQWHEDLYRIFSHAPEGTVANLIKREQGLYEKCPTGSLLLRDMDNHDTVTDWPLRPECLVGHDGMELIQVLNYTFPGIPMVYCGNELADTAHHSMFANRFHPGKYEVSDRDVLAREPVSLRRQELMKTLNRLLAENPVISAPALAWVDNSAPDHVLSFLRPDDTHPLMFLGNLYREAVTVTTALPLPEYHILLSNNAEINGDEITFDAFGYVLLEK